MSFRPASRSHEAQDPLSHRFATRAAGVMRRKARSPQVAEGASNLQKHGIPFDEAVGVLLDPGRIVRDAPHQGDGKDWFLTVGRVDGQRLTIVYSMHNAVLCIRSARKASRDELRTYWKYSASVKTDRSGLDPTLPATLSEATRTHLDTLRFDDLDFSDIPESPRDAEWTCPGPLIPEPKKKVTLRLDRDVLDYFRDSDTRFQTRINNVLRAHMHARQGK